MIRAAGKYGGPSESQLLSACNVEGIIVFHPHRDTARQAGQCCAISSTPDLHCRIQGKSLIELALHQKTRIGIDKRPSIQ